ncbi:MAG: DUF3662 and FHA domain-containing protein [Actinomycetota bacterium]|uniref:DUF3662 and FHA domain-containing protein n=1 Tax=Paenarthrobacter sp. PH39-S1 TaxID=3046204 RepID=UPI0024B9E9A0|nr:DUF3662 and FHA domain-containing protein [Paenarthrobacter sp. PH39-S1]MDJ0355748.1 DUF3662 and FHA domain-containing protein [Paenarthrobacter sp. PH39-S1]MDQ6740357.1 DUF3662 and FHA domain-containing protein [Actinomycetota bacterium]
MGLLDNVEKGIEKAVRGAFSRGSKAQMQPVEIASRLRRELDDKAMTLAAGRTLTPNVFEIQLSEQDFERARSWGTALAEELCDVVIDHCRSQGYVLQGPVRVAFHQDAGLKTGIFEISSRTEKAGRRPAEPDPEENQASVPAHPGYPANVPAAPPRQPARAAVQNLQPVLDIDGQRYSLNAPSIILGRSSEADILIDDTGVSRKHLEIRTENGQSVAVDLRSTNGSYVNGRKVSGTAELTDGSTVTMGRTKIVFRLLPVKNGGRG